jgi:hypothetical protein
MTRRVYGPDASCRPAPRRHHCVAHGIMVIAQNSPKLFDQSGSVCSREEPFTDCWLSGDGWFSPILVTSISWRCIHEANWLDCATRKKLQPMQLNQIIADSIHCVETYKPRRIYLVIIGITRHSSCTLSPPTWRNSSDTSGRTHQDANSHLTGARRSKLALDSRQAHHQRLA